MTTASEEFECAMAWPEMDHQPVSWGEREEHTRLLAESRPASLGDEAIALVQKEWAGRYTRRRLIRLLEEKYPAEGGHAMTVWRLVQDGLLVEEKFSDVKGPKRRVRLPQVSDHARTRRGATHARAVGSSGPGTPAGVRSW